MRIFLLTLVMGKRERNKKEKKENSQSKSGRRKNQKNSQAVSPLNLSARGRRNEGEDKNIRIARFSILQNFPFFMERLNKNLE